MKPQLTNLYITWLNETGVLWVNNMKMLREITEKLVYRNNAETDFVKTIAKECVIVMRKWLDINWMDIKPTWIIFSLFTF